MNNLEESDKNLCLTVEFLIQNYYQSILFSNNAYVAYKKTLSQSSVMYGTSTK